MLGVTLSLLNHLLVSPLRVLPHLLSDTEVTLQVEQGSLSLSGSLSFLLQFEVDGLDLLLVLLTSLPHLIRKLRVLGAPRVLVLSFFGGFLLQ